jgi:hypothetical protein
MTPEAITGFRSFLHLPYIALDDDPASVFSAMARISAWSYLQTKETNPALDELLSPLRDNTSLWMGLLLHLSTIDYHFFHLAKRMTARTLVRHDPPAKRYREMAAALLISDPPGKRKPKLATHVALVVGVAVAQLVGFKPTESARKGGTIGQSGCARMMEATDALGARMDYSGIETAWKERSRILSDAGFTDDDASAFFNATSPMK